MTELVNYNRKVLMLFRAHWTRSTARMWVEFFAVASIFMAIFYVVVFAKNSANLFITVTLFGAAVRFDAKFWPDYDSYKLPKFSKPVI